MPESVATDNVAVARLLAAAELTKEAIIEKSPEKIAETFKTIYKAMGEAKAGR